MTKRNRSHIDILGHVMAEHAPFSYQGDGPGHGLVSTTSIVTSRHVAREFASYPSIEKAHPV